MKITAYSIHLISLLSLLPGIFSLGGCGGDDSTTTDTTDPGTFVFSADAYGVMENADSLTLTVNRVGGSSGSVTVDYATQDATAIAGADYQTSLGTLSFADGITSQSFSVPIINDADTEGTETFVVALSNPTGGAVLGSPSSADVAIQDDESIALYDFEFLTIGNINGQDNWVEPVTNATIALDTSTVNGTRVVQPNTTLGGSGDTEITRVNDVGFSFPGFFAPTGRICYDTTADDNSLFALGQEIVQDGRLNPADGEIGVPFGFWERQFIVLTGNSLTVRAGVTDLGVDDTITDWYRLCLDIDFANDTGSLSYRNLTNGDASLAPIAGLQDLNLNLANAPDPALWNAMFLNLRVDSSDLIPKVDNLMPNVF